MSDQLDRDAAGALVVGFSGTTAPDELRQAVAGGLGAVILFTRNVADADQVSALTASLRAERPDVIIAIDHEGGEFSHLSPANPWPLASARVRDRAVALVPVLVGGRGAVGSGVTRRGPGQVDVVQIAEYARRRERPRVRRGEMAELTALVIDRDDQIGPLGPQGRGQRGHLLRAGDVAGEQDDRAEPAGDGPPQLVGGGRPAEADDQRAGRITIQLISHPPTLSCARFPRHPGRAVTDS